MDYTNTANPFANSSAAFGFGNNTMFGASTATNDEDLNKSKRFNNWHTRQNITTPQDYPLFANQPVPFSSIPANPQVQTAATPYIQKIMTQQPGEARSLMDADEPLEGRRKAALKKNLANSPPTSPGGNWPKSMFGSRPPSRTRNRTSSTSDEAPLHSTDTNAPPLLSIYDTLTYDSAPSEKPSECTFTPTQVRVANFAEGRFPELIRCLRRYYGVILEPYSGLPPTENKFHDPEIVPREQLDLKTLKMIQPLAGAEGGPGNWVRITFRDREAAERAIAGSDRGELIIGGRTIIITPWKDEAASDVPLPFTATQMDIDMPPAPPLRRNSIPTPPSPRLVRKTPSGGMEEFGSGSSNGGDGVLYSEFMPGARLIVPKPVEFAKADGWLSGLVNSLVSAPRNVVGNSGSGGAAGGGGGNGWGVVSAYRYIMDDLVGMKRL
ncbi:uncharacterized protein H6S33_005839 [Morchella sextelata]|uniref:uncharacterized protein n=1 Tax=Morchella sextelata TaxID=1174677 RepID=UPI001D04C64F|nr:uncharacterized protein H6S33_005839 [Morchella sextelata]KAH0613953.1 hypothetical protein H6S33_005839 [Morchella sextelata]